MMDQLISRRAVLGAGVMLSAGLTGCASLPSDDRMIAWFRRKRDVFERIRDMAMEETDLTRVGDYFIRLKDGWPDSGAVPSKAPSKAPSKERVAAYRTLFAKINAPLGIDISIGEGVRFYAIGLGWTVSGKGKGYYWSLSPPSPLVTQKLETWPAAGGERRESGNYLAYRMFEPNWYLVQDAT